MMLPNQIKSYLQSVYLSKRRPFCFLVNSECQLQQFWGEIDASVFETLELGENMFDRAPFLFGTLNTEIEVLPFVTNSEGDVFEVHTIPHGDLHFVVLLDASQELLSQQTKQQTANEVRLLHASQEKLIDRQRQLISDLVEAKSELDHRRREAERNNARKNEFIAMMSHEFRTPLAAIINYSDLALDEKATAIDIRKSGEAIARASRHLGSLVDTVLDDAKLEASREQITEVPFEVRTLIDDLAAVMAPLAAEKGLAFAAYLAENVPPTLLADVVFLRQVLINLLANAVKYTDTGGVTLNICWLLGDLNITVVDTGSGIKTADQERIFQAFERGSDTSLTTQGAGLGLAISLNLAHLMHGRIDIESKVGSGSKISLSVPAPEVEGHSDENTIMPTPTEELHASRPASILICDDDEDMIALCEYYLHRAGYGLILAQDGLEAVEKVLANEPDLVLMDINTPRLNGLDAAVRLRKAGFHNPILAMTASDMSQIQSDCFTDSLRKPFQMPELLAQIKQYLN